MKYPITFDYERDKFCDADGNKIDHSVVTSTFNEHAELERRLKIAVDAHNDVVQAYELSAHRDCRRCDSIADISRNALKAIQEGRDD